MLYIISKKSLKDSYDFEQYFVPKQTQFTKDIVLIDSQNSI